MFTPRLSTGQEYYERTYDTGESEHDYITTLSAGFALQMKGQSRQLNLAWDPVYSHYKNASEASTLRQALTLDGSAEIAQRTTLSIHDSFLYTEEDAFVTLDPIERREREPYSTNNAETNLLHRFGASNALNLGYENTLEENQDENIDDTVTHKPFVSFDYFFTPRLSLAITANYVMSDFDTHNTDSQEESIQLNRKFSSRGGSFARYTHSRVDSEGSPGKYDIHNPSLGITYTFRNDLFVSTGVGLRIVESDNGPDNGSDNSEFSFDQLIAKKWIGKKSEINISGSTGYENNYTDIDNEGFSRFVRGECTAQYQLIKSTGASFSTLLTYNENEVTDEKEARANMRAGIRYTPARSVVINCGYGFNYLESTDDSDEFYEKSYTADLTHTPLKWLQLNGGFTFKKVTADVKQDSYEDSRAVFKVTVFSNYRK